MPSAINSIANSTLGTVIQRPAATLPTAFAQSLARVGSRSVDAKRTRITPDEASAAIREAFAHVTGESPTAQTVALLTAQWAHETAHGALMYNYNFGGIKGTGPTGLTVEQKTKEGWGRTERPITDHFRAYASAQDGANDYVKLLTQHYPEAISSAKRGDANGFVRGLKQRGYFTGDESVYAHSVANISAGLLSGNYSAAPMNPQNATARDGVPAGGTDSIPHTWLPPRLTLQVAHNATATHVHVDPLAPRALVSALASEPAVGNDAHDATSFAALANVSAASMTDEIIRASLLQRPETPNDVGNPFKSS